MKQTLQSIPFLAFLIVSSVELMAQFELPYQDTRRKRETFRKTPPEFRLEVSTFALAGISESVGQPPLHKIGYTKLSKDSMVFEGDGIQAAVVLAPFDETKHRLDYDLDEKHLIRIDKRPYYGDYGFVPKTEISNISMIINGDSVEIPKTAYFDLYNLHFTYNNKGYQKTTSAVYVSDDKRRVYLYLFSKGDKGSYEVTFIFKDRQFIRRVLDYDLL